MHGFVLAWWPWSATNNRHPGLEFVRVLVFVMFMFFLIFALVGMWLVLWFELFIPSSTQKTYYNNGISARPTVHANDTTAAAAAKAPTKGN